MPSTAPAAPAARRRAPNSCEVTAPTATNVSVRNVTPSGVQRGRPGGLASRDERAEHGEPDDDAAAAEHLHVAEQHATTRAPAR